MFNPEFQAMYPESDAQHHKQHPGPDQQHQQHPCYLQQQHPEYLQHQHPGYLQEQHPEQHPDYLQEHPLYQQLPYDAPPPTTAVEATSPSCWTREEDKAFEKALVDFPYDTLDRWYRIADQVPGKSAADVAEHFQALLQDIKGIENGMIQLPDYSEEDDDDQEPGSPTVSGGKKARGKAKEERRRGVPWTEDEHKKFLEGLKQFGKGDWRSISRYIESRTAAQVASHAQKYYWRLNNSEGKEKRRGSIHDITEP